MSAFETGRSEPSGSVSKLLCGNSDVIQFIPRTSLQFTQINEEIEYIQKIKSNGAVTEASKKQVGNEYVNKYESNKGTLFCIITPKSRQIPYNQFIFTFNLFIPSWGKPDANVHQRRRIGTSSRSFGYRQIYLKYSFKANSKQIARIHATTKSQMKINHLYFAKKPYPTPPKETIQLRKMNNLNDQMELEEMYYLFPSLPKNKPLKYWWGGSKSSTNNDLFEYCEYLQKIFSSPSLCIQDYLYDELNIHKDIKCLLQKKAQNKLNAYINKSDKLLLEVINNPKKLLNNKFKTKTVSSQFSPNPNPMIYSQFRNNSKSVSKSTSYANSGRVFSNTGNISNRNKTTYIGNGYHYHTVYIASRPLTNRAAQLIDFRHWALKFEGIHNLLTIEYFWAKNGSKVKCMIIPNTAMNRRLYWYWWQRDDDQQGPQFFTSRWQVIDRIFLGEISTEIIGRLVIKWLSRWNRYDTVKNNCQHFVRDIVAVLDLKVARKLSAFFDHKLLVNIVPAAAVADGMSEEVRMLEVAKMLSKEMDKWRKPYYASINQDDDDDTDDTDNSDDDDDDEQDKIRKNTEWIKQQLLGNYNDNNNDDDDDQYADNKQEEQPLISNKQTSNLNWNNTQIRKRRSLRIIENINNNGNNINLMNAVKYLISIQCPLYQIQESFKKANISIPQDVYKLIIDNEWYLKYNDNNNKMKDENKYNKRLKECFNKYLNNDIGFVSCCNNIPMIYVAKYLLMNNRSFYQVKELFNKLKIKLPDEIYLLPVAWKWLMAGENKKNNKNINKIQQNDNMNVADDNDSADDNDNNDIDDNDIDDDVDDDDDDDDDVDDESKDDEKLEFEAETPQGPPNDNDNISSDVNKQDNANGIKINAGKQPHKHQQHKQHQYNNSNSEFQKDLGKLALDPVSDAYANVYHGKIKTAKVMNDVNDLVNHIKSTI